MTGDPWQDLLTAPGVTREELDEIKAGIMRLAGSPLTPFDLTAPTGPINLPPWPPILEGAWYERGKGWGWNGPDGGREPVPARVVEDAGMPPVVELPDGLNIVFLRSEPLLNLISRRKP